MMGILLGQEACRRAQGGQNSGAVWLADLATILVIGAIAHMMVAFNAPMASDDFEQQFGILAGIGQARETADGIDGFLAMMATAHIIECSLDPEHLLGGAEHRLLGCHGQRPEFTRFHSPVPFLHSLRLRRNPRGGKRC